MIFLRSCYFFDDFLADDCFDDDLEGFYSYCRFFSKYYFGYFSTFSPYAFNFAKYGASSFTKGLFRTQTLSFVEIFYWPDCAIFLNGANLETSKIMLLSKLMYLSLFNGMRLLKVPWIWLNPKSSSSNFYSLGKFSKFLKSQCVIDSDFNCLYWARTKVVLGKKTLNLIFSITRAYWFSGSGYLFSKYYDITGTYRLVIMQLFILKDVWVNDDLKQDYVTFFLLWLSYYDRYLLWLIWMFIFIEKVNMKFYNISWCI